MKKTLKKIETSKVVFCFVNIVISIYFFLLNCLTPLSGDDLGYQYIYGTKERVETIFDVINSQITHYQFHNGRFIVHSIDQFFLIYDKMWFNIANTLVFIVFVLLIYYYVYQKKISNTFLVFLYCTLWFSIPGVGTSIIWQTMSCNYLWGSTIILAFLLPYRIRLENGNNKNEGTLKNIDLTVVMFLCGIIAGWTIEAGGAMLLSSIFLIMLIQFLRKEKWYTWQISGFIGAIIGYGLLIFAPGNFVRLAGVKVRTSYGNLIIDLCYRLARETYYMIIHMGWLFLAIVILMLVLCKNHTIREFIKEQQVALLFLLITFIGIYVMTFAAGYAERVLVTPIAFASIALGCLYRKIDVHKNRAYIICIVVFCTIMMLVQGAAGLYKMRNGDSILSIRTEYTEVIKY